MTSQAIRQVGARPAAGRARPGRPMRSESRSTRRAPSAPSEPRAAVGRRAAADPEDEPPDAGVERGPEHLAGPDRGRAGSGRARRRLSRDRPDASASSTTPRAPSSERSQARVDRSADRVVDRGVSSRSQPPAARSPRASPRRRRPAARGPARRPGGRAPSRRPAPRDLDRRQRALERIGREHDRQRPRRAALTGGPSRRTSSVAERPVGQQGVVRASTPDSCQPSER